MLWNASFSFGVLFICLMIGVFGYHFLGPMSWLDALHNASMILSGMGPVVEVKLDSGKWFSSFYALFSGVAFITNIGILIAPMAHRFFINCICRINNASLFFLHQYHTAVISLAHVIIKFCQCFVLRYSIPPCISFMKTVNHNSIVINLYFTDKLSELIGYSNFFW